MDCRSDEVMMGEERNGVSRRRKPEGLEFEGLMLRVQIRSWYRTQAGCVYTAKSKEWWTMMRGRAYPCIKLELTYVGVVVYRTNLGCGKLKGNSRMESKG